MWYTKGRRFLTPKEVAHLQGFTLEDLRHYDIEGPDGLIRELVGNAFSLPVTMLSILVCLPEVR